MPLFMSEAEAQQAYTKYLATVNIPPVATFVQWLMAEKIVFRELAIEKRPHFMRYQQ